MKYKFNRQIKIAQAGLALLAFAVYGIGYIASAQAAAMTTRSVRISTSIPGSPADHEFTLSIETLGNLGSISFRYCTNSPFIEQPCTAPTGLDVSGVSLDNQIGETGFSVSPLTSVNQIIITRPLTAAATGLSVYEFSNAINPTLLDTSIYVRISTHLALDASDTPIDKGAVVFSTSGNFDIGAFVAPRFIFCVGETVALNCSSTNGSHIDLGELSSNSANTATSQFSISSNSVTGYSVQVFGTTMTSGNNTIPALASPASSTPGLAQFGMNLRSNTIPSVGNNKNGVGALTSVDYNILNSFKFATGDLLASSSLPTDYVQYTVSYLVNVPPEQHPGVYTTTLQYFAVSSF